MKPLPKWLLALAIVLFAFYLLLIPEFGAVPFWGRRWEAGAPPPWRESAGWWGPRFGYGMMNGPVRDWGALGVQGDHGYGDDGGYGYGMMGGGIWPAASGRRPGVLGRNWSRRSSTCGLDRFRLRPCVRKAPCSRSSTPLAPTCWRSTPWPNPIRRHRPRPAPRLPKSYGKSSKSAFGRSSKSRLR